MIYRLICFAIFLSISNLTYGQGNEEIRASKDNPNFILIVADDLGFGDLSLNGSTQINTPNIDRLALSGMNCTQGYVSAPVCSPSRAGLMTGKNQVSFGYDNNLANNQPGFDQSFLGLPLSEQTIAERLKGLGYINGLIGKWHLGKESHFHPGKRGFDEYWTYIAGGHDYFVSEEKGKGYKAPIDCNYKTPDPISYITDDKGNECINFIKRHKDHPFFLFASFNAPHTPLQATQGDLTLYKHISDRRRRTYAAMVHRLDINIGKIIDEIENQKLTNNTIFVFISDNGGPVGSNASINAPFNGQKGILLEGGIHVPFLISWSGVIPSGNQYNKPVSSLDIAPTFFELAGGHVENTEFDGKNLIPFLVNNNDSPHKEFKWKFTISAAIRVGDWKLIRLPDRLPLLFHLPTDVSEQNNLSLQNLAKTKELLLKLGVWDVGLPHPLFLEGAEWKERQLKLYDKEYQLIQP